MPVAENRVPWPWWSPLLAALLSLAFIAGGWGAALDDWHADLSNRLTGGRAPAEQLPVIVGIGERTLAELGGWPLPRRHYARLLRLLHGSGARVVAFDILFDRPAPDPADDLALAAALRETGVGVLAMFLQPVTRMDREMRVQQAMELKLPVPVLASACAGMGFVNIGGAGEDLGVIRACRLVYEEDSGRKLESLALTAARRMGHVGEADVRPKLVRYSGRSAAGSLRSLEMSELLSGSTRTGDLAGRAVFVGATARSLGDLKESPLGELPGVEINANISADLLGSGFLRQTPAAGAAAVVAAIALLSAAVMALVAPWARLLGLGYLAAGLLVAVACSWKGVVLGQAALLALPPLLCTLGRRRPPAPRASVAEVREALDSGRAALASERVRLLPAGTERDALTAEALVAARELDSARRLLPGLDRGELQSESMYRLARALEEAGSLSEARELYGLLFRRDLEFRDAGKRFLALDERLVQETTVLGPEGVLQALRAVFDGVERVASGASGLLYRCVERETGEAVAVKVLDPRLLTSGEALARFRREVEVLESLAHPGIVRLRGATFGKLCYYRMDFIEGQSLAARMGTGWRASESEAVSILGQAAAALAHAHEAGVLHRDLKPSNLMLGPAGRVVVVDFGVARIEGAERLTREGTFVGTMSWAAPEQLRGEKVDVRADIYSLGAAVREAGGQSAAGWMIAPLLAAMSAEDISARPAGMREVLARLEMTAGDVSWARDIG